MITMLIGTFYVACMAPCIANAASTLAPEPNEARNPAAYVQPIDRDHLAARLQALPPATLELIEHYMEGARRYVLTPADGVFPIGVGPERYRNLAERAKGAAVLSSIGEFWPLELRQRCRKEAAGFVRETAMAHRAKPNFDYPWQATFWAAEAGIAGWFLWDELDDDTRSAVAEMVIFQANRLIGVLPKMEFRGNTEAETVAWNSTILTLAVNMMPRHPHARDWDETAKRYVYNTCATARDAANDAPGDDGKTVGQWIVGANLYPDLTLENHNQFHIDYVLTTYRFHTQGVALYWLTGRPLPKAFHLQARDVYEKVLLRCMTADGFFAYVSDNDWKRYHCWAESCLVHAYLAMLEQHPLAAALEKRALKNAVNLWRAFPSDFEYNNPYVCGKAWTSRIADAVLMHITCPTPLPQPLSSDEAEKALRGTSRLDTPDLLTHYAAGGSYASSCKGRGGAWVAFVAPRDDAWMLLPIAGNYQARVNGKPVIQKATTTWQKGPDWFWLSRRQDSTGSAEAFVSLPDGSAVYVHHLVAADVPPATTVENTIAIEKPHLPMTAYYAGGNVRCRPGQDGWQEDGAQRGPAISGNWLNLQDRFGLTICSATPSAASEILLPKAGARDAIRARTVAPSGTAQDLWLLVWPNQAHAETETTARKMNSRCQGQVLVLQVGESRVFFNPTGQPQSFVSPATGASGPPVDLTPGSVSAWRVGQKFF